MNVEQAEALAMICHYAKEHLKDNKTMSQSVDIAKDIIKKELKALEIIRNIGILKPYETIGGQCWLETICDATKITKENYDSLKEVGL